MSGPDSPTSPIAFFKELGVDGVFGLSSGEPTVRGSRAAGVAGKTELFRDPGIVAEYVSVAEGLLLAAVAGARGGLPQGVRSQDAQGAVLGLWPLGEGTFLSQLQATMEGQAGATFPALLRLYHCLLEDVPVLASAAGLPPQPGGEETKSV